MLYEISFVDGSEAEYENLASADWSKIRALIRKHGKPFKLTPADNQYLTEYCFPVVEDAWIKMYFFSNTKNMIPSFLWVNELNTRRPIEIKELLKLFVRYFSLPEDLDPSYAL